MKKKEILMITVNRSIDRRIINEARVLARGGFTVVILARSESEDFRDEYNLESGVSIVRFKAPSLSHRVKTGLSLNFIGV